MIRTMSDLNLQGKRVLVRQDLNVPVKDGQVTSTARIDAALPTLLALLEKGAKAAVMSHLGRPEEGFVSQSQLGTCRETYLTSWADQFP